MALEYVHEVDYIICSSDVNTSKFPSSKIIGNKDTNNINNKYRLFKYLHKNFLMPDTYLINDSCEAYEIQKNNPKKRYILKPVCGSGGVGIRFYDTTFEFVNKYIMQEYIIGDSVSSSFLAYPDHSIDMITSSDILVGSKAYATGNFMYCGNITPSINHSEKLKNISSKIARMCKLIGSNGVDFVIKDDKAYVIEVNPRIQGTFECIERSFNINMAKAHINASKGERVDVGNASKFAVKLITYSPEDIRYDLRTLSNVYDISPKDYMFKKGEPVATILTDDTVLENAMGRAQIMQRKLYNSSY